MKLEVDFNHLKVDGHRLKTLLPKNYANKNFKAPVNFCFIWDFIEEGMPSNVGFRFESAEEDGSLYLDFGKNEDIEDFALDLLAKLYAKISPNLSAHELVKILPKLKKKIDLEIKEL
jgi:serine protease inhibitor